MSIYTDTIETIARDPRINRLHSNLSAGDVSILYALLEDDTGVAMTTPGSANANFWRCLSDHGWMSEMSFPLPDESPIPALNYRITDRGYRAIPVLLGSIAPPDLGD